jgi:hypothetical protein
MATPDFASAATRHLADARRLHSLSRFDNAVYHSGYGVECSLKAVIERTGLRPREYGHRLVKLERDGLSMASLIVPGCVRYCPAAADVRQVSDMWTESMRYNRTGTSDGADSLALLAAASRVWRTCVGQMFLDGLSEEPR